MPRIQCPVIENHNNFQISLLVRQAIKEKTYKDDLETLNSSLYQGVVSHTLAIKPQDNTSVKCIPPYTPLLYRKTGVYRGIHFFLFLL